MTTTQLQKGANTALTGQRPGLSTVQVSLGWRPAQPPGMEVDASAFALTDTDKVRGDGDLVFYNNPRSPEGFLETMPSTVGGDIQAFRIRFGAAPAQIQKIAFTVTIHEGQNRQQNFGMLEAAWVRVLDGESGEEIARFELPLADTPETAMIFCEVYRHREDWKFRAVGQGFVGGLAPLATYFGIDVAEAAAPPAPPPPAEALPTASEERRVRLEKRVVDLEKKDPALVSLVKRAGVQLEKRGLHGHQAKVALALDISGSMHNLYRKGSIDELVRRVLALGFLFDDDGEIDVFLFGSGAYHYGGVNTDNYHTFVKDMLRQHQLEGGTHYGKVMALIRNHYRQQPNFGEIPVYVMFATDGDTLDREESESQIREAAREGIFWQFMAIGTPPGEQKGFFGRLFSSDFRFLEYLDTMEDRFLDNANFFLVRDPAEPSDEALYERLMAEYPQWLAAARERGLIR